MRCHGLAITRPILVLPLVLTQSPRRRGYTKSTGVVSSLGVFGLSPIKTPRIIMRLRTNNFCEF